MLGYLTLVVCATAAAARRLPLAQYIDPNNPTGQLQNANGGGTIRGVANTGSIGGQFTDKSPGHIPGQIGQSEGKGSSQGIGDPILTGFDGRTFEFMGQVGSTYNLLSEANHQLSTRLKHAHMWDHNGTYMEAFSLRYRSHDVEVTLDAGDHLAVTLDGTPITLQPGQDEAEELLGLTQGELHIYLQAHRPGVGNSVELTTDMVGLLIWVTPAGTFDEGGVEQPAYLNFDLSLLSRPSGDKMEGVVGHTYSPLTMEVQDADDFDFHHDAAEYEMAGFLETGRARVIYGAQQAIAA